MAMYAPVEEGLSLESISLNGNGEVSVNATDERCLLYYSVPKQNIDRTYTGIEILDLLIEQDEINNFLTYIDKHKPFCLETLTHLTLNKCIDQSLLIYLLDNGKNIDELSVWNKLPVDSHEWVTFQQPI
ncbi:unnamed protein product, partial [Didymodactylos carnosus]